MEDDKRELAAELRASGLSLAEVGRRLGVSKQRVHQLLRSPRRGPVGQSEESKRRDRVIAALVRAGHSDREIGTYLRVTPERVYRIRTQRLQLPAGKGRGRRANKPVDPAFVSGVE